MARKYDLLTKYEEWDRRIIHRPKYCDGGEVTGYPSTGTGHNDKDGLCTAADEQYTGIISIFNSKTYLELEEIWNISI